MHSLNSSQTMILLLHIGQWYFTTRPQAKNRRKKTLKFEGNIILYFYYLQYFFVYLPKYDFKLINQFEFESLKCACSVTKSWSWLKVESRLLDFKFNSFFFFRKLWRALWLRSENLKISHFKIQGFQGTGFWHFSLGCLGLWALAFLASLDLETKG